MYSKQQSENVQLFISFYLFMKRPCKSVCVVNLHKNDMKIKQHNFNILTS